MKTRTNNRLLVRTQLIVALLMVVLAACAGGTGTSASGEAAADDAGDTAAESGSDTDASGEAADDSSDEASDEAVDEPSEELSPVKVALVVHFQSPFTQEMQRGAQTAADELEAELVLAGPPAFETSQQIAQFNDVVAAGAQGVATVPFPSEQWLRPLQDAQANGVKIATLNVPVFEDQEVAPLYVGVNELDIGRAIARLALDALGEDPSGSVVVGNCLPGVQVLVDRVDGIKEVMAEEAPGIEVLGDFDTTGDPTSNYAAWESLMIRYDDAVAFAGVCAPDLPSMVQAKERLGIDAVIVGNDFDPEVVRGLQEGIAQGSVGQSPFLQGYVPIRALIEAIRAGEDLPVGWVDSGVEIMGPDDADELAAITSSDEAYMDHYLPRAQAKFEPDLESNVQPLDNLKQ